MLLDLSGQPIMNIDFIRMEKVPPLVTLILDDCLNLHNGSEKFIDIIRQILDISHSIELSYLKGSTGIISPRLTHGLCSSEVLTILRSCNVCRRI